jgi:hypothetical protein
MQASESAIRQKDAGIVAHALRMWQRTRRRKHGTWFAGDVGDENATSAKRLVGQYAYFMQRQRSRGAQTNRRATPSRVLFFAAAV